MQGGADTNVPLAMAQWLHSHIPGAAPSAGPPEHRGLRVFSGEGHMSLVLDRMPDIMAHVAALAGAARGNED